MRYPTSKIYLIGLYAYHVRGLKTFTSRDLYNLGRDANKWYDARISKAIMAEKLVILHKYGFTEDSWHDVLTQSLTFYFSPTHEMNAASDAIRKLLKPYPIINGAPYYDHYCRALVTNAVKRGVFQYTSRSKMAYRYRINPKYVSHPIFD